MSIRAVLGLQLWTPFPLVLLQGERFVKRELLDGESFVEREAREVEFDVESGLRSFGKGFTILEDSVGRELTKDEQVPRIAWHARRPHVMASVCQPAIACPLAMSLHACCGAPPAQKSGSVVAPRLRQVSSRCKGLLYAACGS